MVGCRAVLEEPAPAGNRVGVQLQADGRWSQSKAVGRTPPWSSGEGKVSIFVSCGKHYTWGSLTFLTINI